MSAGRLAKERPVDRVPLPTKGSIVISSRMYDEYVLGLIASNLNMLIPWYLMACFAYYEEDNPIISDWVFDRMAKSLDNNWDTVQHRHKEYLTRSDVAAQTYLNPKGYPLMTKASVWSLRKGGMVGDEKIPANGVSNTDADDHPGMYDNSDLYE